MQQEAVFSKNPLLATLWPTPNGRQTQLATIAGERSEASKEPDIFPQELVETKTREWTRVDFKIKYVRFIWLYLQNMAVFIFVYITWKIRRDFYTAIFLQ